MEHAYKTLYIHGFNGSPDGSTAQAARAFFGKANVVAPQLDLLDYEGTMTTLRALIQEHKIQVIFAHSFGAFYALSLRDMHCFTVVANPCMKPSLEIPRLDRNLTPEWAKHFYECEERLYYEIPNTAKILVFGIFADGDELFSYGDFFAKKYGYKIAGLQNSTRVHGSHRIEKAELHTGLAKAGAYYETLMKGISDSTIRRLEECGEIVIARTGEDELVN